MGTLVFVDRHIHLPTRVGENIMSLQHVVKVIQIAISVDMIAADV
jgi:hypothetical protein